MRRYIATVVLGMACSFSAALPQAASQTFPKSLQQSGSEDAIRQRMNEWTIGLAGGKMDGTWLRFADELSVVLDDGDNLRVIPMISRGAANNVLDLLYLHGVDAAFTQADALEYFRSRRKIPNIDKRIQYIIRLPIAELHVTARADIHSLQDLRGQKVAFGAAGTAATITAPIVFERLGIKVQPLFVDRHTGLQMLLAGQVAALLGSLSKPADLWLKMPANAGLHLLPVPFTKELADLYVVGEFTHHDYPNLVPPGQRIDTIAVPSVLAVYNWPKNSDRYRRLERFVQYLFNRWDRITKPPYHPRWRDVNLAATVPGWTRFAASEEMLKRLARNAPDQPPSFQDFQTYMSQQVHTPPRNDAERDAMFRRFLMWRQQQHQP